MATHHILTIRLLADAGTSTRQLAEDFGRHENTIRQILNGDLYPEEPGPVRPKRSKLADDAGPEVVAEEGRRRLFTRRLVTDDGCWQWPGAVSKYGYGQMSLKDYRGPVHRLAFMLFVGPIEDGLVVDHECHNRSDCEGGWDCLHRRCFNPDHLRATTHGSNIRSGRVGSAARAKTQCPAGHPYDEENTYVRTAGEGMASRHCRACKQASKRRCRLAVSNAGRDADDRQAA